MRFFGKLLLLFVVVYICFPVKVLAYDCDNRIVTFVNPVRDRLLWDDQSLEPILSQKRVLSEYGYSATWLIQYEVLDDKELVSFLRNSKDDEIGLFLEISENLARDAGVYYKQGQEWYFPNVVFLSGYERNDRKKLIDTLFYKFKNKFGYWPKSVGAWWIDSYSSQYMESKYDIETVLIVANQKTTDNYGVWGQWWGWSYYPWEKNILIPAKTKQGTVVIQWAQRHPSLAYFGQGSSSSNYSLQANDYMSLGLDLNYFDNTLSYYLDCRNKIGQITIGMETGMEGYKYMDEYESQVKHIDGIGLQSLTMSQYSKVFKDTYPNGNPDIVFGEADEEWKLTSDYRQNDGLGEKLNYSKIAFSDYFKADKEKFLNRDLSKLSNKTEVSYFPYFIVMFTGLVITTFKRSNKPFKTILVTLSSLMTGLLVFRSYCDASRCIFFGPTFSNIQLSQVLLVVSLFSLFWFISKYIDLSLYILSFGLLYLVSVLRYSQIDDLNVIGFVWKKFYLIGLSDKAGLFYRDLDMLAKSVLRINLEQIYSSWYLYLLIMPVVQICLTIFLKLLFKKINKNIKGLVIVILIFCTVLYIYSQLMTAPISVI